MLCDHSVRLIHFKLQGYACYNSNQKKGTLYSSCIYTGAIDCGKTALKLIGVYDKLIKLPIKSMLPQLYCNKVITEGQKKKIEVKELESDGMQCFLDEVLILSLKLDMSEIYNKFIKILEDSDDLIQRGMAKKIGEVGYL